MIIYLKINHTQNNNNNMFTNKSHQKLKGRLFLCQELFIDLAVFLSKSCEKMFFFKCNIKTYL